MLLKFNTQICHFNFRTEIDSAEKWLSSQCNVIVRRIEKKKTLNENGSESKCNRQIRQVVNKTRILNIVLDETFKKNSETIVHEYSNQWLKTLNEFRINRLYMSELVHSTSPYYIRIDDIKRECDKALSIEGIDAADLKFNKKQLNESVRISLLNMKSHFDSKNIEFASLHSMVFDNHISLTQISSYLKEEALSSDNLANVNSFLSVLKQREIHLTELQFLHIEFRTEISHIHNELCYLENLLNVFTYASLTIAELSHHINKLNVFKNKLDQWFNANDIKLKITEY